MEEEIIEIDHTADIGFIVRAKSLDNLIEKSSLLLSSTMIDLNSVEIKEKKNIEIKIEDESLIIIDVLRELLYFFETEGFIWKDIKVFTKNRKVFLELKGEKFESKKHKLKKDVKAITYHDYYLVKKGNFYETRFIFDV
ncbi:MAG: archease [Candidatus Hydrothermales bacterium]